MMVQKRSPLGRGLSALLPDAVNPTNKIATSIVNGSASVCEIPVSQIEANPFQPRHTFDEDALQELADSIRTLGIIQPVTLRRVSDGKYQIISGERRCRAAGMAGLTTVPAYIRTTDDVGMLEMAIVENVQRENLDAIETALSYQRLMDECELTQEAMAARVGKKRATVANYLRLLNLPDLIQKELKLGRISVGHAKALLGMEDTTAQVALCEKAVRGGWSVRQLEQKVQDLLSGKKDVKPAGAVSVPDTCNCLVEKIGKHFDDRVKVKCSPDGSGTITIRFRDESQIKDFLNSIR